MRGVMTFLPWNQQWVENSNQVDFDLPLEVQIYRLTELSKRVNKK